MRLRRKSLGISQGVLSERVGVSFQQIQKYETGANRVAASRLWEMAEALDVSPAYFFDGLLENGDSEPAGDVLARGKLTPPRRADMKRDMESLIHHFKLVTQGFRVPAGQVYQTVEHAKGILGVHAVSDGGTRPYRVHFRDPSFSNLQSLAMMGEGGMIADLVPTLASIDPVLGGVDR